MLRSGFFFRKTRSVTVPRFGFLFQDSRIRVRVRSPNLGHIRQVTSDLDDVIGKIFKICFLHIWLTLIGEFRKIQNAVPRVTPLYFCTFHFNTFGQSNDRLFFEKGYTYFAKGGIVQVKDRYILRPERIVHVLRICPKSMY